MPFFVLQANAESWQDKIRAGIEYELYQSLQRGVGAEWSVLDIHLSHIPFKVPSYCSIDQNIRIQFGQGEDYHKVITKKLKKVDANNSDQNTLNMLSLKQIGTPKSFGFIV